MSVTIPQTAYSQTPAAAKPGMLADCDPGQLITGEFIASEQLLPGRVVELDPTDTTLRKCRYPQTASAVGKLLGVVVYSSADPVQRDGTGGFVAGSTVRILRRGRIYAEFTGTAGSDMLTALKVRSASDNSNSEVTHRGKLTDASASTTTGQEVYATKLLALDETSNSPSGLCLVELNGPLT